MALRPIRVLGIMTGTSCDALDGICSEFQNDQLPKTIWRGSTPFPAALRKRVLAAQKPGFRLTLSDYLLLERDLGRWFASAIERLLRKHDALEERVDLIANHGQTIAHHPELSTTLQAGDPAIIANQTGLTVVSHFRQGDLAAGGQGAPLVPLYHRLILEQLSQRRGGMAIHNLGGASNLTYLGPDMTLLAFDTGPANYWIDDATLLHTANRSHFDREGQLARQGTADEAAVRRLLCLPYFAKKPPKSTGRDDFPFSLLRKTTRAHGPDLIATATEVTARSIAAAYQRFIQNRGLPIDVIYFSGGGSKNLFLLERIAALLPDIRVEVFERSDFDPQYIEAQAFGYFGWLTLSGKSLSGAWTGARPGAPPGQITPGRNWLSLLELLAKNGIRSETNSWSD